MRISVVIPTIGRSTLERAVASAGAQSTVPTEIVLVNNGRDAFDQHRMISLEESAGGAPLRVLTLPPFSGPSIARNLGAWHAFGEYVAFLDDDDEFKPDYLQAMLAHISETGPDILYGAKVWYNRDGSIRREKRLSNIPRAQWFESLYKQENPGAGGTNLVVRREILFELGGFPVDLPSGEDRAFAMAALRADARVVYVDEAEVSCHDPEGYRAKGRSDKWVTNLKLIREYWHDVRWNTRLRSIWRWSASFVRSRKRRAE